MLGKWFDSTEVDAFAERIVAELRQSLSPADCASESKKVAERMQRLNDRIARHVEAFSRSGGLNVYKKAKLGSRVQEALAELGYPEDFRRSFVYDLVALVAMASARKG